MHSHADAVVVDDVLGDGIVTFLVSACIGKDDVGIASLKGLQGDAPFLHHVFYGQIQLFHHSVQYVDVRTRWHTIAIEEFVGRLVPVANHHYRPLFVVLLAEALGQQRYYCRV